MGAPFSFCRELNMIVIGVTGGVACGKSTVSRKLKERLPTELVGVFDSDAAVKELMTRDEVVEAIKEIDEISAGFFKEGGLLKDKFRKRVFDNSDFRERVQSILHPLVSDLASQFCEKNQTFAKMALMEIPLLYEVSFPLDRDLEVVVAASRETQLARLQSKRHLDCELAERVVASQLPTEEKINRGDILVWNDGNEEALDEQIRHLVNRCLPIFD